VIGRKREKMEKSILREKIKKQRDQLTPEERQAWDAEIWQFLWALPQYQKAQTLMTYLSFGSEVNTWPIVERAWVEGKTVLVPKIRRYPKEIIAVAITSCNDLEPGLWGIYEPISDVAVSPQEIDLIIVPGLAFDSIGYRLGYGGGYYDRFLPQVTGYKVGLCYPPFFMEVPIEPWDQCVDLVIYPGMDKKG